MSVGLGVRGKSGDTDFKGGLSEPVGESAVNHT